MSPPSPRPASKYAETPPFPGAEIERMLDDDPELRRLDRKRIVPLIAARRRRGGGETG